MAKSQEQAKSVAAYGREALSEWGDAIRYGGRAIAARAAALNPSETEKRGRLGDAADAALAKFGKPGRLASKASLGSRIVDRIGGGASNGDGSRGDASSENGDPSNGAVPVPIQESIDVAVPLGGVFELCSQFLDFPDYLARVVDVEEDDETHFVFLARSRRHLHEMEVEIVDERDDERIEWECAGDLGHTGVLTFHPLAPRLTRLELTVERRPEGISERLARQVHLPERAIEAELHRFKAHAELLDESFDDYIPEGALGGEQVKEDELEPA